MNQQPPFSQFEGLKHAENDDKKHCLDLGKNAGIMLLSAKQGSSEV